MCVIHIYCKSYAILRFWIQNIFSIPSWFIEHAPNFLAEGPIKVVLMAYYVITGSFDPFVVHQRMLNYAIYTANHAVPVYFFRECPEYICRVEYIHTDCRYDDTRCLSEVIHDIHNGVQNSCRTNHRKLLFRRNVNDDFKYYVYTVSDKRKFIGFPFPCNSKIILGLPLYMYIVVMR